jgi:capsular polysaccharide biosynthesis protein
MSPLVNPGLNPVGQAGDNERLSVLLESLGAADPDEARIPISQYWWILKRQRWRILGFCAAAAIATVIISARLTPIFESTTTVDVDRQTPPGVVGPEAALSALNDTDQFLATQMKLVQSDGVLRPVEERFGLRLREGQAAEQTGRDEAAPITLKRLRVTRPPNTYLMLISYRSDDPQLAADAANAIAESYLEHSYDIRIRSSAIALPRSSPFAPRRCSAMRTCCRGSIFSTRLLNSKPRERKPSKSCKPRPITRPATPACF